MTQSTIPNTIHGGAYYIGISLLGILIGVLAGLSQTPVVNIILPLLFGLIGGAGGFFLANATLDNIAQTRLSLIGKSLTGFCLGALIGVGCGISLRTGSFLFPPQVSSNLSLPKEALSSTEIAVRAIALRNQLNDLGATNAEIEHIMQDTFVTHPSTTLSLDAVLKDTKTILSIAPQKKTLRYTGPALPLESFNN